MLKGRELLNSLRSGGDVSRRRIYHDAPRRAGSGEVAMPKELYREAGDQLDVPWQHVAAIFIVEGAGICLVGGAPLIRFEPHKWDDFRTGSREAIAFDRARNPREQYDRWAQYEAMYRADPRAAVLSHSFGGHQQMGFNARMSGVSDLDRFVALMGSLDGQMQMFVSFIRSLPPRAQRALRERDAHVLGNDYNGPGYRRNRWHTKWEQAIVTADSI